MIVNRRTLITKRGLLAEWVAQTTPEFWEEWFSLTENGGANEIWRLVE
jgi:hypothetical protein